MIYNKLLNLMDNILNRLVPVKTITIAIDGVAPLAKLKLQQQRRMNMLKNMNNVELNLSVGTKFMDELKGKLTNYLDFISKVYGVIVYFDDNDNDEAEIKIERKIIELSQNSDSTYIVVSSDTDVIVMLMMLKQYDNIYIHFINSDIISLSELLLEHIKIYGCSEYPNIDFSIVSLLIGNDYLPKIKFLTFKIWDYYKKTLYINERGLYVNGSIDIFFLCNMLLNIVVKRKSLFKCDINKDLCCNYYEGLKWCINMYMNGKCIDYDYCYNFKGGPMPWDLIINSKYLSTIECKTSVPLPKQLYTILILPIESMIDKRYHKFMKCIKYKLKDFMNNYEEIKVKFTKF